MCKYFGLVDVRNLRVSYKSTDRNSFFFRKKSWYILSYVKFDMMKYTSSDFVTYVFIHSADDALDSKKNHPTTQIRYNGNVIFYYIKHIAILIQ
jgi:hypothetical protein